MCLRAGESKCASVQVRASGLVLMRLGARCVFTGSLWPPLAGELGLHFGPPLLHHLLSLKRYHAQPVPSPPQPPNSPPLLPPSPPWQEDFYSLVDWAFKVDPLACITMVGLTEAWQREQQQQQMENNPDASGGALVTRKLLLELQTRIRQLFYKVRRGRRWGNWK